MSFCRSIVIAVGSRAAAYTFTIRPVMSRLKAAITAIRIVRKNFFGFGNRISIQTKPTWDDDERVVHLTNVTFDFGNSSGLTWAAAALIFNQKKIDDYGR